MRTEAVRIHRHGGPELLTHEFLAVGSPGAGEVQIRQTASALSFADIYLREGDHGGPHNHTFLPTVPGSAGAGHVLAVGDGVAGFRPGNSMQSSIRARMRLSATYL